MEWCSHCPGINSCGCLVIGNERGREGKRRRSGAEGSSIEPWVQSLFRPLGDSQGSQWLWPTGETQEVNPGSSQLCFMRGTQCPRPDFLSRLWESESLYFMCQSKNSHSELRVNPHINFVEHLITVPLSPENICHHLKSRSKAWRL